MKGKEGNGATPAMWSPPSSPGAQEVPRPTRGRPVRKNKEGVTPGKSSSPVILGKKPEGVQGEGRSMRDLVARSKNESIWKYVTKRTVEDKGQENRS